MEPPSDADDESNIQDSFDSLTDLLVRGTPGRYYFNTSKSSRFQASGALHLEDLYDATVEEKRNFGKTKPLAPIAALMMADTM